MTMDSTAADKLYLHLYRRIHMDKQFFSSIRPVEYKPLSVLLEEEKPSVRLASGSRHVLDRDDLERLRQRLPWYMHSLVKLPFYFIYSRVGEVGQYRLAGPDKWAAKALGLLLAGDITVEKWRLTRSEMARLLSSFKTLIIVSLSISV
ncbi:hypothetical protein CF15_02885 [Pyrodictium occultum]|uniref:Uncharacterized protein n=2 Tax=Pyrodictium occultum TaxID=2309 RepID=A0A0V8RUX9_PYROC|nr:hypothetical protein CF15_02885 [Pyrodictium occultum]